MPLIDIIAVTAAVLAGVGLALARAPDRMRYIGAAGALAASAAAFQAHRLGGKGSPPLDGVFGRALLPILFGLVAYAAIVYFTGDRSMQQRNDLVSRACANLALIIAAFALLIALDVSI